MHYYTCWYVSWLFALHNFQCSSITTYLAALQFHVSNTFNSPYTIWHKGLHQVLKGFLRIQTTEAPIFNKTKLPFTRDLIQYAQHHVLGTTPTDEALHAALCLGFMFLLRKSEYLTDAHGLPTMIQNRPITLLAQNVIFWFGETSVTSSGPFPTNKEPDFISIHIIVSKADQFGKGATRFFPTNKANPHCLARWVYRYARNAHLATGDSFFWSSSKLAYRVHAAMLATVMKLTALRAGIQPERVSLHSLRIGGLVALFAAGVPNDLKQLAGRWSHEKSFIAYARAMMEQFAELAEALNNPRLVSCAHIRKLYSN